MRKQKALKNILWGLIAQGISILLSFVSRKIFILFLGYEMLGINTLFTSITSILVLLEFGIGTATTCILYRTLSTDSQLETITLFWYLRYGYRWISGLLTVSGLILLPFLQFFFQKEYRLDFLAPILILHILDAICSFLFLENKIFLIADQNGYLGAILFVGKNIIMNIFQIVMLFLTKNVYIFLCIRILSTLLENIVGRSIVRWKYPYLQEKPSKRLSEENHNELKENIFSLAIHNIGNYIIANFGILVLSIYLDSSTVGVYSSYAMVSLAVLNMCSQFFTGLSAGIGNAVHTTQKEKTGNIINQMMLLGQLIYSFAAITFIFLINPFVTFWLGPSALLPVPVTFLFGIYIYLNGMGQVLGTFRAGIGLFKPDRLIYIALVAFGLILSIILVPAMGISGLLTVLIICTAIKELLVMPWVVYNIYFQKSSVPFYKKYIKCLSTSIFIFILLSILFPNLSVGHGWEFMIKLISCFVLVEGINLFIFRKTNEMKMFSNAIAHLKEELMKKAHQNQIK